jgi:hypothetical protein
MEDEKWITPAQAVKLLPKRLDENTIRRWMRYGVRSRSGRQVYLRHVRMGRSLFTTATDLREFAERLARSDSVKFRKRQQAVDAAQRSKSDQDRQVAAARERLRKEGFRVGSDD